VAFLGKADGSGHIRLYEVALPSVQRSSKGVLIDLQRCPSRLLPESVVNQSLIRHPDQPHVLYRPTAVSHVMKIQHHFQVASVNENGEMIVLKGRPGDHLLCRPGQPNSILTTEELEQNWIPKNKPLHTAIPTIRAFQRDLSAPTP